MDLLGIKRLLARQCGVCSRRQLLAHGATDNDIQRMIRRRELTRIFEGVYVDHTGPPTADQGAWAAVLFAEPAALAGTDALRAHGIRGQDGARGAMVHIVVPATRRVQAPPGVRVTRTRAFDRDVQLHLSPPRQRVEAAALTLASEARTEDRAVAVLADLCQVGGSKPARLLKALHQMPRLRHRRLLEAILTDVATGAYSALERRYLVSVERSHRLPTGQRQRRVRIGRRLYYRDVSYLGLAVNVELDGRLGHDTALDRWADLERDLATAAQGELTLRVGWLQVLEPCRLAWMVGTVLVARGWDERPSRCGPECEMP